MKRILSLVLISALLITSLTFGAVAGASASDHSSAEAELLFALGVTETSALTEAIVTRAQFVRYAMKLAGIPLTPYNGTQFADVPSTHADYSYIMSAVDFGLISIADIFRPEDAITPNEAFKITVELLGYDFMAEAKGGYPSGYLQTAQSIDLLDGVNTSNLSMSEYDVCTLLCNALKVNLPEVTYSDKGAEQYRIGTATLLSQYRGIVEVNGIVDGVSHYSEYDASGLGEGRISVNGIAYNVATQNYDMLFGYDVTAYYDTKSQKIISCTPTDSNRVISVYAEDIESYKGGTFTYIDKSSNTRSIALSDNATIFYNGRAFNYNETKMLPDSGSLTFVSAGGSGAYNTLYIKSYKTIAVSKVFRGDDEFILIDKFSNENNLKINPDETTITVADHSGKSMSLSSIVAGDVVNAAVSDDTKVVELICVDDEFIGTYSGNGGDYIDIDGKMYRLTTGLKAELANVITLGKQAIFRLDIDQRIADAVPTSGSGEELGYLVVGRVLKKGMTSELGARILNLDGKIYDYYFADTFNINGKGYKDCEQAYADHKSSEYDSLLCSVVKYTVDDEGKIKSLTYSDYEGGNGGLYFTNKIDNLTNGLLAQSFNNINNQIITDKSTIIFKVPNPLYSVDNVDDELYSVEKASIFYGENSINGYRLVGYTTNPDDGMSKYLLAQKVANDASADVDVDDDAQLYMVSSVSKVVVDGDFCEKMELCGFGASVSSPLIVYSKGENDFTAGSIAGGDIIRIMKNDKNMVQGFEIIWKNGASTFVDGSAEITNEASLENTKYKFRMVYAYGIRTDVIDAVSVNTSPANVTMADKKPLYVKGMSIFKYDNRAKAVVEIPVNEIKDYENFGNDRSVFIYAKRYQGTMGIFMAD